MGIWGTKLYQDDLALDVKEEYINWLKVGMSNNEATNKIIKTYEFYINDVETEPTFWFALADTQWKYGRLLPKVKKMALNHLKKGTDLFRWQYNEKLYKKRQNELKLLEEKLNSPQPLERKVTKLVMRKAAWEIGDVLLYQLKNESLKGTKWYHKYVLFRVIDITTTNKGSLPRDKYFDEQNMVCLYDWIGEDIPNINIINTLKFIEGRESSHKNSKDQMAIFTFSKKDLKLLDIKVLLKDNNYKYPSQQPLSILGVPWLNIYNLEPDIIAEFEHKNNKNI